ncbi:MAG: CxxxxCH/CxxCH domain-containing protein [Deltaproteobacteria bacterium]|nr:CxxxxCH/CxxCH domain-containing protein [Deltaproteobacteria bacterium]
MLLATGCGGQKVDTTARRPQGAGSCTDCHGSAGGGNSAPPRTSKGATATTDPGVGAHDAHVLAGPLRRAMACSECHPTPETAAAPGHDNGVVEVVFGGLANAGGATPVWNRTATATAPALSCSATYCHGGTLHDGLNRQPVWTKVDGTQATCGTCHAIPPTWSGHPDVTALAGYDAAAPARSCNQCHPSTVDAAGNIDVAGGKHIDGILQIGAKACTLCHGDATRTPPAIAPSPPGQGSGFTFAAGAHLAHLQGTTLAATPVACSECHPQHLSMAGHPQNGTAGPKAPARMAWGALSSAGGSVPTLVTGGASPTCSTTYCHGATLAGGSNTAPAWNAGPAAAACGACHGIPPTMAPAGPHPDITGEPGYSAATPQRACYNCHPGTVDSNGNLLAAGGFHLNGYVDLFTDGGNPPQPRTCTTCHGDPAKAVVIHAAPPKAVGGATATSDRGVGAHDAHLRDGLLSVAMTCNQCHPTVTNTDHAAVGGAVNGHVVDMAFGPLATNLGTSWPTWNGGPRYDATGSRVGCGPNGGDCTCSSVYCHGDGLTGGSHVKPLWTGGAAEVAACDSCHGVPPPSPHVARLDCGTCHAGYTSSTVNLAAHVNGVVDATTLACTVCHGDATRTPATAAAAPPMDTQGRVVASARGVGAHERHLVDGLLRRAMPCSECHVVPTVMDHANGAVDMVFGPLARTAAAQSAQPTWNPTSLTCSSVYCHGATLGGGTGKQPVWTTVDGTYTRCGNCHGIPPPAPHVNSLLCGGCHPGFTSTTVNLVTHINGTVQTDTACTNCHGTAGRTPLAAAAAPPTDLHRGTSTTLRGVGAHQAHLTAGTLSVAMACSECHTVPANVNNHPNNALDVTFGPLARGSGAAPVWNGSGTTPALTCSATYCHGATLTGGTLTAPAWTRVDGTQAACGTCHGVPPPTPEHTGMTVATDCATCHGTGYSGAAVTGAALRIHVDGQVQASGACSSCHGDANNPVAAAASAPPLALATSGADRTSTSVRGVGAHQAHLVGSATAPPIACSECHPVPSTSGVAGSHRNDVTDVVFGPLSRTGGVTPVWNGTGTTPPLTCSATYCHGATLFGGTGTSPVWTTVDGSFKACSSCHGIPPPSTSPSNHPTSNGTDCGSCHAGYTATTVDLALHLDGKVDATGGSCSSCHGDANRTAVTGADAQVKSAPPKDHRGNTTVTSRGVGAHIAHVNKGTGAIAAPIACAECHVVPATVSAQNHNNGSTEIVFGPRSRTVTKPTATTPAAGTVTPAPAYNTTSLGCSATYCHGNYSSPGHPNGKTGETPAWNATGGLSCTSCHAVPTDSCHPPRFNHEGGNSCSSCHRDTNSAGTAITNPALHVNGVVNGKCTDCHSGAAAGSSENRTCVP